MQEICEMVGGTARDIARWMEGCTQGAKTLGGDQPQYACFLTFQAELTRSQRVRHVTLDFVFVEVTRAT